MGARVPLVTEYNLTILTGLDIPIALLPPAPADAAPAAPSDINTGGQAPSGETTGDATIEEVTTGDFDHRDRAGIGCRPGERCNRNGRRGWHRRDG